MKRDLKSYRIPQPLIEALRIAAFETRQDHTEIVVAGLASELERSYTDKDTRIGGYLAEYREALEKASKGQGALEEDQIPKEYK